MKYIIMCGGNYKHWETPRQLMKVNGEVLVERTIRLLRKNGIEDIAISTNNPAFDYLDVPILKHENNFSFNLKTNEATGYWCEAFYLTDEPVCYLFGDVYFSENAIKTIINTETDDIEFFASKKPFTKEYIKTHEEPFALKVVNTEHLKEAIEKTKQLEDEKKFWRRHCMWEVWTVIKKAPLQTKRDEYTADYVAINDITCDIDKPGDVKLIENMVIKDIIERSAGNMKIRALRDYTDNVLRKEIKKGDEYEVSNERGKQILSHPKNLAILIEIVKEEPIEDKEVDKMVKETKKKPKTTTKKKVAKK